MSTFKLAIVGGIGSGKSVVSQLMSLFGVPVYDCDAYAKQLMDTDLALRAALIEATGPEVYTAEGHLNRKFLASYMFGYPERVARVNSIVHPVVKAHFASWAQHVASPIVAVETAILFESGMDAEVDAILVVHAPEALRLQRAMSRDGVGEDAVRKRMASQMNADELLSHATYIVYNDDSMPLIPQVDSLLQQIREL